MIYLYWYLGIGVVVLAFIYRAHYREEKKSKFRRAYLEAVYPDPDRKKLSYRILNNIVVPVLTSVLVVTVWPVAVYMGVKKLFQKKERDVLPEKRVFAVEREHLLERLTLQEIERREVVSDPLKAVPDLPFGHLNAAWQEFLQGKVDGTELWSFSEQLQTTWGRKELRCGYLVVQDGVPGTHFLTVCKDTTWKVKPHPSRNT